MLLPESKLKLKKDSKWVENCEKTWQLFVQHASAAGNENIEDTILKYLFSRYNNNPKLIRPKNIANWANQLFEQFENEGKPLKPVVKNRVRKVISDWERFLLQNNNFEPKQPPYLSLKKLKKLSWVLWKENPTHRCKWLYKAASVCYVYTWLSGARMQDILRLEWQDLTVVRNNTGAFIKARVRHSKGNKGKRGEQLTVMIIKNDPCLNMLTRLKHWWKFLGKPTSGLLFRKPTKKQTEKSVFRKELKPFQIKQAAQRAAKALNWKDLPMAKSGRNSIVPVILKLGIKSQLCNIFMRWTHQSQMLSHYQSSHLEFSTTGTAYKLGKAIESGQIYELEKDIY